jgi:hypothetical protein
LQKLLKTKKNHKISKKSTKAPYNNPPKTHRLAPNHCHIPQKVGNRAEQQNFAIFPKRFSRPTYNQIEDQ